MTGTTILGLRQTCSRKVASAQRGTQQGCATLRPVDCASRIIIITIDATMSVEYGGISDVTYGSDTIDDIQGVVYYNGLSSTMLRACSK